MRLHHWAVTVLLALVAGCAPARHQALGLSNLSAERVGRDTYRTVPFGPQQRRWVLEWWFRCPPEALVRHAPSFVLTLRTAETGEEVARPETATGQSGSGARAIDHPGSVYALVQAASACSWRVTAPSIRVPNS